MTSITSMAELKRHVKVGLRFRCENLRIPEASGTREVVKAQTNAISYRMEDGRIGWMHYPKASEMRFDGGAVTFLREGVPAFIYYFD